MSGLIAIRPARLDDAAAMAGLRAASITQLCSADHHDDPADIAAWIGPPDKFVHLLGRLDHQLLVAEIGGELAGLGGASGDLITLNYVHPEHRFSGVGKALMLALERLLAADGIAVGRLNSSATARRFYHAIGWVDDGPFDPDRGQPMRKLL